MTYYEAIERSHAHLDEMQWLIMEFPDLLAELEAKIKEVFEPDWAKEE